MKYKLEQLFKNQRIKGICLDSRDIKPGYAFFAITGHNLDGNHFIGEAFNRGASLVFTDNEIYSNDHVIYVKDIISALEEGASIFYKNKPSNLIAVTGTNGKSSVVSYCRQMLQALGMKAASLGTLGLECQDEGLAKKFTGKKYITTPDIITFKRILNDLAKSGIDYLAFEASSHGLQQRRIYNTKVKAAGFTSFSQDHLNYHKTMDDYMQVKLKLFYECLEPGGLAVINSDILEHCLFDRDFFKTHSINFKTVGNNGDVRIHSTLQSLHGQKINFSYSNKEYSFTTNIIGAFQASNILISALLVCACGFEFDKLFDTFPYLTSVRGRLERVTHINSHYHIFVDYAHTPHAIENSLVELRKIKQQGARLIVLFGCGGNKDKTKRPIMGNIVSRLADYVIVTDDNPRTEDPGSIRKEILSGCNTDRINEIGDRREAIFQAVKSLQVGDILLVAGKGHEDYQVIGDKEIPFDDVAVVKEALRQYGQV